MSAECHRTPVSKRARTVIALALWVHFGSPPADRTVVANGGSAQEEATTTEQAISDRVLRFPADRAMGVLYFRNVAEDHSPWADWRRISLATGEVPVPVGEEVRLDLSAVACKDLSPLRTMRPDDLRMLYVRAADLDAHALASIGHLTGLHHLDFSSCNLRDSDTKHLAKLVSLESLVFQDTPVGDASMADLASLERLSHLGLSRTRVTEKGMAYVAGIKSLKSVLLSYSDIGDRGLEHLKQRTSLEDLYLSSMQYVTDTGLSHVTGLTRLRSLDISETSISDSGLAHLSPLKELRVLRLGRTGVTDAGLAHLKSLAALEELILPDGISDDGLAHLATLTSLRKLTVRPSHVTDAGLAHLSRLDKLEFLNLAARQSARGRVSDRGAVHLAGLKSLRTLWLQFSEITDEGLATLAQLESLESILLNENQITSDGLRHLARFPSLTYLNIAGLKGPAVSLRHLASLERLTHLHLGSIDQLGPDAVGTGESDGGLGYLAQLQKLQSLELGNVPITDRGLKHLSGLHSLHRLELTDQGNAITDDGLVHLADMQELEYLRVRGAITDRGLEHLAKLGSLRFVAIESRTISERAIEALKQQVPSLQEVTKITQPLLKKPPNIGEPAPNFEVRTIDGRTIRLSDLRGKAVLLYFWATWCTPCVAETPELKTLHEELSKEYDRFEMLSLSLDEDDHLARRHVARFGLKWPQAWIGFDSPICADFAVESSPRYVLIDPDGKLVLLENNGKEIRRIVSKMLD